MPILTRLPSVRTTFTMIRPSMTMFSLVFRERTSMVGMGWQWNSSGRGRQRLNGMMETKGADVGGNALLAGERMSVDDERSAQVQGRLTARSDGHDVQNERVIGG